MPEIYIPFTIAGMSDWLIVLTAMEPASLTRSVVEQVYAIDRDQIFEQKFDFHKKIRFLSKNSIFEKKFNFEQKFDF